MKKRWLDIPTLSQKNSGSGKDDWCGRTSSSMVHNYYQMLSGNTEKFIINGSDKKELVYPNGDLAARKGDKYYLGEPLERVKKGWKRESLFPNNKRKLPLSSMDVANVLQPIIDSININNPVVVYTGISRNQSVPNHIVVISGYRKEDNGEIWLLIDDPATMRDTGATDEKSDFLGIENLQIIDPGLYGTRGCRYWLKASRLFEKNQRSTNPDDLWCDHSISPGFVVWHNTTPTPDSNYSHFEETTGFSLPQLVRGVEQITATQTELANYYTHTEKEFAGGYFPVGGNTTWHGGLHLLGNEDETVHAVADGVIVCARMPMKDTKHDSLDYGSRNFVLVRHGKDEQVWYSLYYHLKSMEIDSEDAKKIIWLSRDRLEFSNTRNLRQIPSEEDNIPIHTFVAGDTALILNKDKDPWYYVQRGEVNCSENRGYVKFSGERMSEVEGVAEQLDTDDVIQLNIPVKHGDVIGILGEGVTLEDGKKVSKPILHWSIFSPEKLPGFIESVDDDCNDDFLCDNQKIIELVENSLDDGCGLFKADGKLSSKEIEDFFKDEERAKKLRAIACKFKSEWSIKWEAQTKVLSQAGFAAKADVFNLYNFWDQVSEIDDKLPTNGHVWHYNPITFLQRKLFNAARANISSDMFEADKAFVLPNEALSLLSGIGKYTSGNVIKSAILIGHEGVEADTLDPAELSQKRADAVAAILTLDKDKFNQFLNNNEWGNRERRIMLSWFKTSEGVPYFEGSIEKEDEAALEAAVRAFQGSYKDELEVDGIAGKDTFTKMYELILNMAAIKKFDKVDARGAGKTHAEAKGKPSACVVEAHFWTSEAATTIEEYDQNPADTYKLWLGSIVEEIQPVVPTQSENQISFIPMVYTTTDLDRKNAVPLQAGSFLYIFHNNKLIRELQVQEETKGERTVFKEVDLNALRQKHNGMLPEREDRQAIIDSGNDVVRIPYNGKGNEGVFEVAVSLTQWGAKYIQVLENDKGKREARTQTLDFSGNNNESDGSATLLSLDNAQVQEEVNVLSQTFNNRWIAQYKGKGLSLAYLQDSVWQAGLLASHTEKAINELSSIVVEAKKHPHFDSAVVAYPLLFSEEVTAPTELEKFLDELPVFGPILAPAPYAAAELTAWTKRQLNASKQAMEVTDRGKIEAVLKVEQRRKIRAEIRKRKKALTDWLDRKSTDEEEANDKFIPFTVGIIDHFSASCLQYNEAFKLMSDLIQCAGLPIDPSDPDAQMSLPGERSKEKEEQDAGVKYLKQLIEDKAHPLHKMLFATEKQISVLSDEPPSPDIVPIDGTGRFRHHAFDPSGFKEILNKTQGVDLAEMEQQIEQAEFTIPPILSEEGQVYRRIAEFSAVAMSEFISQLTDMYLKEAAQGAISKTGAHALFTRSLKATDWKKLGSLQVVGSLDEIPPGKVLFGFYFVKGGVSRNVNNGSRSGKGIDIIIDDKYMASTNASHVGGHDPLPNTSAARNQANRGGYPPKLKANTRAVFVVGDEELARYVNVDALGLDVKNNLDLDSLGSGSDADARRLLNELNAGASDSLANKERLGAGLSAVAGVFNAWNTVSAYNAWQAQGGWQKGTELIGAILDLGYAVANAIDDAAKLLIKAGGSMKSALGRAGLLRVGGGAAALSMVLAAWQCFQESNAGDKDAAVAQAIMAFGFATGLVAEAGVYFSMAWAGPVGWIAAGIVLLGAFLYLVFNDSELERWAKNGPFRAGDDDLDDTLKWMQKDQDGFPTYEHLMGVFFQPTISFEHTPDPVRRRMDGSELYTGEFIAKIHLPALFPTAKVVDLEAETAILAKESWGGDYLDDWRYEPIKPVKDKLTQGEDGQIHKFHFKGNDRVRTHGGTYIYQIRLRIKANEKLHFPVIPRDDDGKRKTGSVEGMFHSKKELGYVYGWTGYRSGEDRWYVPHDGFEIPD